MLRTTAFPELVDTLVHGKTESDWHFWPALLNDPCNVGPDGALQAAVEARLLPSHQWRHQEVHETRARCADRSGRACGSEGPLLLQVLITPRL